MKKVLSVYKPVGVTPLELIHVVRKEFPEYSDVKIGYAGRLDPLAHGVLLLMVGDATKERDRYLSLDKTYEFEALFGVETDTYDMLGVITPSYQTGHESSIVKEKVNIFVNEHLGTIKQSYPPYSSKAVNGKPLFWWARNGKLSEIQIPFREVTIQQFEVLSYQDIAATVLQKKVRDAIGKVKGDFRQTEILGKWEDFFAHTKRSMFQTAQFRISCSSGTYVRELVHELGSVLGVGAIALDITRTQIGNYTLAESLLLTHSYP